MRQATTEGLSEPQQGYQEHPEIKTQPKPPFELQPDPQSTQLSTPTPARSQVQSKPQPNIHTNSNGEPGQAKNDKVLTPPKSPDPEDDRSVGEASGKSTQSKKRARAPFEQPGVNLPAEDACDLTNEQITALIHQGPKVRKKYEAYFNRNGSIRTKYHALVLAKSANGDYLIPESIIRSNVNHWKGPLDPLKPGNSYGTGRKQGTRDTSAKRSASNELYEDPPPTKRTKAEMPASNPKSEGSESSAGRTKGDKDKQSADGSKSQSKLGRDSRDRPGKARKSVQPSNPNVDNRPVMVNKSTQASNTDSNANAAALMGSLLNNEVSDWFRGHDENDLDLLNNTELLLLMLWLNSELRALQYSLAGALHLDCLGKSQHKEMLEAILRAMSQLICVCNELARYLQAEAAIKK